MATALLALLVLRVPDPIATAALATLTAVVVGTDWLRLRRTELAQRLERVLPAVFRTEEAGVLSGASLMFIGYTVTSAVFPAAAAAAGILCLALGDAAAAIVGRTAVRAGLVAAGRKTWPGTLTCGAVSLLVIGFVGAPDAATVIVGAAVATLLERLLPGRWDNLAIPPGVALVVWLGGAGATSGG
jgi:dolichol kinase